MRCHQKIVYKLVDSRTARILRVYDFFLDEKGWGYIVMEFIEEKVIDPCTYRGLLFLETEDLVFDSLRRMEECFNSRLFV